MQRQLEPELMESEEQVAAYARADFSEAHELFISNIRTQLKKDFKGSALDLGCGPGDISQRFARYFPDCLVDAVDGSKPMLKYAKLILPEELTKRICLIHAYLPSDSLPLKNYEVIVSNSLLHHLPEPAVLWQTIQHYSQAGTQVFIMDLLRPENRDEAKSLMQHYAAGEPEILRHDFYHSLLAAFTLAEIQTQLERAHLNLNVQQISDRHVYIAGEITSDS